jgi:nucleotide-binding universal stress UspA family protein
MAVTGTIPVVVVGIDGSSNADAALRWAQTYAESTGALLRLVVAWEWPTSYGYPMTFEGFDPQADAARVAEKATANLSLPVGRIETAVREGSAGDALIRSSADADLLVVGRRGHHGVAGLLGSVSSYCVHHATTPVVVVRP